MELKHIATRTGRLSRFLKQELGLCAGLVNKLKWSENELIGWDYGHCNDYVMYSDGLCSHGKKYTTSDLINDCIEAIDMLNDKEDEETLAYICD